MKHEFDEKLKIPLTDVSITFSVLRDKQFLSHRINLRMHH